MEKNVIKIFGIERSGTNYLQKLLQMNFNDLLVFTNGFGWKHGKPQDPDKWIKSKECLEKDYFSFLRKENKSIDFIVIIKDPYYWHNSIKKFAKQKYDFHQQFTKYNTLYGAYIDLLENNTPFFKRGLYMRYEDILKNPGLALEKIQEFYGYESHNGGWFNPVKVFMSPDFGEERKKFYFKPPPLDKSQIHKINKMIDDKIFKYYGYKKRLVKL